MPRSFSRNSPKMVRLSGIITRCYHTGNSHPHKLKPKNKHLPICQIALERILLTQLSFFNMTITRNAHRDNLGKILKILFRHIDEYHASCMRDDRGEKDEKNVIICCNFYPYLIFCKRSCMSFLYHR